MTERKFGAAKKPKAIRYPPTKLLSVLGKLHTAELIPEATPRSSSTTMPIITDCFSGVVMLIKKILTAYTKPAET
jgi:hypothetical protein